MAANSYRSLGGGVSWVAGGTIHIARFVKPDSTAFQIVEATSGDPILGIMQEGMRDPPGLNSSVDATIAATTGDKATFNIYYPGDRCRLWMINAVTAGQYIKASTAGKGTPHTTGTASVGAIALTAAAADELGEVLIVTPGYVNL